MHEFELFLKAFEEKVVMEENIIHLPFYLYGQPTPIDFLIEENENNCTISTYTSDLKEQMVWFMGDVSKYMFKIIEICNLYHVMWKEERNNYIFSITFNKNEISKIQGMFQLYQAVSIIGHMGYSIFAHRKENLK